MKLFRDKLCLYFLLQIIVISLCYENTACEDLFENTSDQDFIDPHSFYYNRHKKEMQKPLNDEKSKAFSNVLDEEDSIITSTDTTDSISSNCNQKLQECKDDATNALAFEIFSRRLVNILMSHISFDEEIEVYKGNIYLEATSSQMQTLRDFGSSKGSIRTVDSILSEIIRKPSTTLFEDAISYSELILSIIHKHKYTCIGILVVMCVLFVSRYIKWTRKAIILLIIDLILIISFFMTWYQLVKEAEIKQTAKQMMYAQMPIECQPEKMSTMQYFISKLSFQGTTEQCEKYVEAMIVDPFVQVTPAQALSHLCTNFILHPLSVAGHAIGDFVDNATVKLSWPMRWTVTLLLFIGVALLIIVLPFSLFGGSLGFGIGPLFHFTLGKQKEKEKKRVSDVRPRERIELIREVPTNITIQRIEASSEKKKDKKVLKKLLEKKENKEEETQSEEDLPLEAIQGSGDFVEVDKCNKKFEKLELADKEEIKVTENEEMGSGDR